MNDIKIDIIPKTLHFKQPAGTSRGVYTQRKLWYLKMYREEHENEGIALGEIAPLPQLSCDDIRDLESIIHTTCQNFDGTIPYDKLRDYPSVLFGLEMAWQQFQHIQNGELSPMWDSKFSRGEEGIIINGLIWMGTYEEMKTRIEEKLQQGFHCIKVKIGAIDFDKEFALLQRIRQEYSAKEITLRVDANGGFSPDEAMNKLQKLASLDIHSIEQPIKAGQWKIMAQLCNQTPLPIALDEELIGVNQPEQKERLLDTIQPQFIILKPSLHGGIHGCEEWIRMAKERGIGYWITSALESNVGLLAIAQWASTLSISIPQGLGTGALFTDNIQLPLQVIGEKLWYKPCHETARILRGVE